MDEVEQLPSAAPLNHASARLVGHVIDDIGMGPYQAKETVISGCAALAEGAELLLVSSVARAVAQEWDLTAAQKGSVVSIVFIGVLIGNLISGPCSDRIGRRWPIIISVAAVGIFSILSAFTEGIWTLSIVRCFVGLAFGFGVPASCVLCLEIAPTSWRSFSYSLMFSLYTIGEAYSALIIWLDDPSMRYLHWRWLLIVGALPAIMMTFLSVAFLNESPSWLASRGREEEAREVLSRIMRMNGSCCAKPEFSAPRKKVYADIRRDLGVIFGPAMLYTTLVSCFTCFSKDFIFFGGCYVLPQVLSETVTLGTSPAFALFIGVLFEVPGIILALGFDRVMDRRPTMAVTLVGLAICMLSFAYGGSHKHGSRFEYLMLHFGYAGYKCLAITLNLVAFTYAAEIYPVSCRVTGSGLSIGVGRIGAVISPLAYEWITEIYGTWTGFFYILACFVILNAILVAFLPFETRGKALKESIDDDHETDQLCQGSERPQQCGNYV